MSDLLGVVDVRAEREYPVYVGRGLVDEILSNISEGTKAAIIHQPTLRTSADALRADLESKGVQAILLEVPDAEDAKSPAVAEFCWNALGSSGFTRSDSIIGLGGGAVTDLAGFIAGTWLRGVRCVLIPTTLLAMVDAAVGGKTGINTDAGKNLVGVFSSPAAVVCDLTTLEELPRNELVAGIAEVVKVGLTSDASIVDDLLQRTDDCLDPTNELLGSLVLRAISVKASVVSADFREEGSRTGILGREVLNYGHTFGHAVEKVENYRWRHGAAVSVGLMYVAELSRLGGKLSDAGVDVHRNVLTALGLPTTYRGDRWEALLSAMAMDKKSRGSLLRFVVLKELQQPVLWEGPDPALLHAAYESISA